MVSGNNVETNAMASRNNWKTGTVIRLSLTHLFIITLGLLMIYPIVWMIVSSFKPQTI